MITNKMKSIQIILFIYLSCLVLVEECTVNNKTDNKKKNAHKKSLLNLVKNDKEVKLNETTTELIPPVPKQVGWGANHNYHYQQQYAAYQQAYAQYYHQHCQQQHSTHQHCHQQYHYQHQARPSWG
jgi:maltose-binding protein MalE